MGVGFAHFGARDPESQEDATSHSFVCPGACTVLMLEDVAHEKLLRGRLHPSLLPHLAAIICLDLKVPWAMLEDLQKWFEVLQRVTSDLLTQLPLEEQDELRNKIVKTIRTYEDPNEGTDAVNTNEGSCGSLSAFSYNLGIPLIVVVTRADTCSALETPKTTCWSETIEAYLRNECLSFGAAIVYTTVQAKNSRNVDVLYEYLMHRLYGYTLRHPPVVPSRDALFIPSGWDSSERVNKAAAGLAGGGGLDPSFESIVVSLEPPPPEVPPLEKCEDIQSFLKRSAVVLQKLGAVSAVNPKAANGLGGAAGLGGAQKSIETATTGAPSLKRAPTMTEGAAGGTDNAMLANFFQNLLTRGQSSTNLGSTTPATTTTAAPATATRPSTESAASVQSFMASLQKQPPVASTMLDEANETNQQETQPPEKETSTQVQSFMASLQQAAPVATTKSAEDPPPPVSEPRASIKEEEPTVPDSEKQESVNEEAASNLPESEDATKEPETIANDNVDSKEEASES